MSSEEQARRLERLKRIEERFTEEISEPQVLAELDGDRPVSPFAVITSEGSKNGQYKNGTLFTAATSGELVGYLTTAAEEGQVSYGRIWDLRTDEFDLDGNLIARLEVRVYGKEEVLADQGEPDWLDDLDPIDLKSLAARLIREGRFSSEQLVESMRDASIEKED